MLLSYCAVVTLIGAVAVLIGNIQKGSIIVGVVVVVVSLLVPRIATRTCRVESI